LPNTASNRVNTIGQTRRFASTSHRIGQTQSGKHNRANTIGQTRRFAPTTMTTFRTTFSIPESKHKISLNTQILTLGSCFADVVGNQLKNNKLQTNVNPFGTLFNPLSIFKILSPTYTQADERLYVHNPEAWLHYDFHSQFSSNKRENLKEIINKKLQEIHSSFIIYHSSFLVLTFGTSFIYKLLNPQVYVANCHKMPKNLFEKELLSVKDICRSFAVLYKELKEINPDLRIILTVSPVRHTKDGMAENQVSKSILRAACHYLTTDYQDVEYFPSYEIMMDDLRDYRFYKPDMIHPNEVAEQYIFEKFSETYFDEKLKDFIKIWQPIQKALAHRPFEEKSESHQKFLRKLLVDLEEISELVNVEKEVHEVRCKLGFYITN
jgi:GSCFA family